LQVRRRGGQDTKHSLGKLPINALKQVLLYLERIRGKLKDVDIYAVNFDLKLFPLGFKRR
jgi:hypothetical protein